MQNQCCSCGAQMSITDGINAEIERKELEDELSIPVPIIGILCAQCTLSVML